MSKKKIKPFTDDMEYAFDNYSGTVQCGDCYMWYGTANHDKCPNCESEEWVGSR